MPELPEAFIEGIKKELGSHAEVLLKALDDNNSVSIRYNPYKNIQRNADDVVPWESDARYLSERPSFTADPLFHAGCYYVQEASSMMIGKVLAGIGLPEHPVRILDLCAAPGGKTTQLASLMRNGDLLVANEVIRNRISVLEENVTKWGVPNVMVTNNDPADFQRLHSFFDIIVVDAPCSGEGLFRRDPEAVKHWSPEQVQFCADRQGRILEDIWPALKPGGILVYSTCTYNHTENEDVLLALAEKTGAEFVQPDLTEYPVIASEKAPVFRCIPGVIKGEGFSFSVLKKTHANPHTTYIKVQHKSAWRKCQVAEKDLVKNWIEEQDFEFYTNGKQIRTWSNPDISYISQHLKTVAAGTEIAELKGTIVKPAHGLAVSTILNREAFPEISLNAEEAILYLKREMLRKSVDERGYHLVTYHDVPLGFVKSAGNRLNNHYPMNWRIRKV